MNNVKQSENLVSNFYYKTETIEADVVLNTIKKPFIELIQKLNGSNFRENIWFNDKIIFVYKHMKNDIKQHLINEGYDVLERDQIKYTQRTAFKVKIDNEIITFYETGGKKKLISYENGELKHTNGCVTNFTELYEDIILLSIKDKYGLPSPSLSEKIQKFKTLKGDIVYSYLIDFVDKLYTYLKANVESLDNHDFVLFDTSQKLFKQYRKLGGTFRKDNWNPADLLIINKNVSDKLSTFTDMDTYINYVNSEIKTFYIIPISLKFNTFINDSEKKFHTHFMDMEYELKNFSNHCSVNKLNTTDVSSYYKTNYIKRDKIVKNVEYRYEITNNDKSEILKLRLGNRSNSTHNNTLITFESAPIHGMYKLGSINKELLNELFDLKSILNIINKMDLSKKKDYISFMNSYVIGDFTFTEDDYNQVITYDENEIRYFMGLHAYVYCFHKQMEENPSVLLKSVFKIDKFNSNYIKAEYL